MISLDLSISQYLFDLGQALPAWLVSFFATYLIWLVVLIIAGTALWEERRFFADRAVRPALGAVLALGINSIIGWAHFRARPFVALDFEPRIAMSPLDGSFPSDHAAIAWALALAVFARNKKIGALGAAAALAISIGRILAGVHFVLDAVVGALVGIAAGFLISWYARYTARRPFGRLAKWLRF